MEKITRIVTAPGYQVYVYFENNDIIILDLKEKINTVRFSDLRKLNRFIAASTDGRAVIWPGGISISIGEIKELAKKNS